MLKYFYFMLFLGTKSVYLSIQKLCKPVSSFVPDGKTLKLRKRLHYGFLKNVNCF